MLRHTCFEPLSSPLFSTLLSGINKRNAGLPLLCDWLFLQGSVIVSYVKAHNLMGVEHIARGPTPEHPHHPNASIPWRTRFQRWVELEELLGMTRLYPLPKRLFGWGGQE